VYKNEAREQVVHADLTILNKVDLTSPSQLEDVEQEVRSLNPHTEIIKTSFSKVELKILLGGNIEGERDTKGHTSSQMHDPDIDHIALFHNRPVTLSGIVSLIRNIHKEHPGRILRIKGILTLAVEGNRTEKVVVQGVGDGELSLRRVPVDAAKESTGCDSDQSRLTLIGRNVGALRKELNERLGRVDIHTINATKADLQHKLEL
ncbi:hypothetical protein HDU93_000646, partial [Gonapodya sp. JEL0774]